MFSHLLYALPWTLSAALPAQGLDGGVSVARTPAADAVLIRAGTFTMGSDDETILNAISECKLEPAGHPDSTCHLKFFVHEEVPHRVYLSDFWIDRREVTVAQYGQCAAAGRCAEAPYAAGGERLNRPDFPVVFVTWNDAQTYCAWVGGRLPTEAEWERAAKGMTQRIYPWGNVYNPLLSNHGRLGWDSLDASDGFMELAPVGSFPDGRTADGIVDLAGNAEEWVSDYYEPNFPNASVVNPKGPDHGDERVVKGGSYGSARPWLRSSARAKEPPNVRRAFRGFRCVKPVL